MALYGFDDRGVRRIQEAVHRTLGSPRVGAQQRRQTPVLSGGPPIKVLGPCASYTPAVELDDTDFETAFPGGCEGPSRYGLVYSNPVTATTTFIPLEYQGSETFSSDTFTHTCVSGTYTVYVVLVFTSLAIGGVDLVFYDNADDSVLASYQNNLFSWYPNQGGYLQNIGSICTCVTFAYQVCLSVPTR